ncbi:MAG: hypothetical protein UHM85_04705 [Acutalibacteraceae bacterium]|nr:hypothetical protein [Acutalibacteraceae bacterium]
MKKIISIVSIITVLILCFVGLSVWHYRQNPEIADMSEFNILITNSDFTDDYYDENTEFYEKYFWSNKYKFSLSGEYEKLENLNYSFQLSDGRMCVVDEKENRKSVLKVFSASGEVCEKEFNLDWVPNQVFEYNNKIVVRRLESLFFVDFNSDSLVPLNLKLEKDVTVRSNMNSIYYNYEGTLYIFNENGLSTVKSTAEFVGSTGENTYILEKHMKFGIHLIYSYDAEKDKKFGYRLSYLPGNILGADVNSDGRYLFAVIFYDHSVQYAILVDLKTGKNVFMNRIDAYGCEYVQWL